MRLPGILTGEEFLQLCAECRSKGLYVACVDVVGLSYYRVRSILPLPSAEPSQQLQLFSFAPAPGPRSPANR